MTIIPIARRAAALVSTKATTLAFRASRAGLCSQSICVSQRRFITEKVPQEDYYDGHLLVDHLEYLDDMLEKTLDIENSMNDLKNTNAQKRQVLQNSGGHSEEMEALFIKSESQKEKMSVQIAHLKKLLANAQSTYAVRFSICWNIFSLESCSLMCNVF